MKARQTFHFIITTIIAILTVFPAEALGQRTMTADKHDSIRLSLLTCAAGQEIYSLFGHSAIRYENYTQGIDLVFNYGIFDFNAPNFVLRFALGETDYKLGVSSFEHFTAEYTFLGRDVWQQTLNLRQAEKITLITLLATNYRPENRTYRYNFFYDNCATRPRDMIEKAVIGQIVYASDMTDTATGVTFRDMLREYSKEHPWASFSMDLCMGPKADKQISRRTQMFVPFHLQEEFRQAHIQDSANNMRPLISDERTVVEAITLSENDILNVLTPMRLAWLLFIIVLCSTFYGVRHQKSFWGIDLIIFPAAGLAGCILTFLALFSQHPAVSPNYLIFLFHPLHLLCIPFIIKQVRKREKSLYMMANLIVLTFFIAFWPVIPQRFDFTVLPLALSLITRSAGNILTAYQKQTITTLSK